jgi:hypothetical protein
VELRACDLTLTQGVETGSAVHLCDAAGCTVKPPGSKRKGHPFVLRLDLETPGSRGFTKYVLSVTDSAELIRWTHALKKCSAVPAADAHRPDSTAPNRTEPTALHSSTQSSQGYTHSGTPVSSRTTAAVEHPHLDAEAPSIFNSFLEPDMFDSIPYSQLDDNAEFFYSVPERPPSEPELGEPDPPYMPPPTRSRRLSNSLFDQQPLDFDT